MLQLLSIDSDFRLKAHCVTARCNYEWFLEIVRGAERNLEIQRDVIKGSKAYATLRADLKRGCIIPPIVLALKNIRTTTDIFTEFMPVNPDLETALLHELSPVIEQITPTDVYIIDGLQRTNAILKALDEIEPENQGNYLQNTLRVELWLNIPFGAVAYKMLLLNAGQRPMSIKQQVEILSMKLQEELSSIPYIEVFTSFDGRRRTRPGQFQLSKLAQAFQAWLQGQPNLDLRNSVMEQLLAETAIETLGQSLNGIRTEDETDAFKTLIEWIVKADFSLSDERKDFFGNETVLLGLAAAVGAAERNPSLIDRMYDSMNDLMEELEAREPGSDPLAISVFDELRKGIDTKRLNVGAATRDIVFGAFQEYFYSGGVKPMAECWRFAAGRL